MFSYSLAQKICQIIKCKQQFENSSCLCSRFINHNKQIWDQIICMKYSDAIEDTNLKKLHVQFWFHSIFNQNYDNKAISCSMLKYHRAYCLYITLLISLKYLIWRQESKMCWFCLCHKWCLRRPCATNSLCHPGKRNQLGSPSGGHSLLCLSQQRIHNHLASN